MSRIFYAAPFNADFPGALLDFALSEGSDAHNVVFLFPHNRPGKYMLRALAVRPDLPRPLLEPSFRSIAGLFAELRGHFAGVPLWNAGQLDRAGLLFECIQGMGGMDFFGPEGKGIDPSTFFFPWGFHLAELFEECLANGVPPADISHAEAGAAPFAARILERLGRIFPVYAAALRERAWTTPGLDAFHTAEALREGRPLPENLTAGKRIYIAGFHTLTRPEETLLHHLIATHEARVIIRTDLPAETAHWSCAPLFAWAKKERAEIAPLPTAAPRPPARIRFIQGFDLHSQLAAMRDILAEQPLPDPTTPPPAGFAADTAVIPPSGGLLVPTIHHLPATDINVSMGWPLFRSPLFRLIETILRLEEGRKGPERHWRDLLELVRHPVLAGLDPAPPPAPEDGSVPEPGGSIRRELHLFEEVLRSGGAVYVDPPALWEEILAAPDTADGPIPAAAGRLVRRILQTCLTGFEAPGTLHDLGSALEGLCGLLLEHGRHLWPRFPMDSECLYRLLQSLIPELLHSVPSHAPLSVDALFALLRNTAEAERVPFEAEPLTGLQVLGVLESRLLSFRRTIILDAGEHVLPGTPQGDPLLPDALRPALGLPERRNAEVPLAHHFFSLVRGAEETVIFWREGGDSGGLFDGKALKSRFVEELLWEEEKKLGRQLAGKGIDGPLRMLADAPAPISTRPHSVRLTPASRALLDGLLAKPVSASFLDAFLFCPVRFFHERILGLREVENPSEEYDPPAVGVLLHKTLEAFYRERLGYTLPSGVNMPEVEFQGLYDIFLTRPELAAMAQTLPADAATMLRVAGVERLRRFLRNQPACTPVALELSLSAPFGVAGREITLAGTVDRLDIREHGAVILDYKTGKIHRPAEAVWEEDAFWEALGAFTPADPRLPAFIAASFPTVQLPLYIHLAGAAPDRPNVVQAAWVELAAAGEEVAVFGKKISLEQRGRAVAERIPQLLDILLLHLTGTDELAPRAGAHCRWCSCKNACMVPVAD